MVRDVQTSILSFVGGSDNRDGIEDLSSIRPYPSTDLRRRRATRIEVTESEDDEDEDASDDSGALSKIHLQQHRSRPDEEDEEVDELADEDEAEEGEAEMTLGALRLAHKRVESEDEDDRNGASAERDDGDTDGGSLGWIRSDPRARGTRNGANLRDLGGDVIVIDDSDSDPGADSRTATRAGRRPLPKPRSATRSRGRRPDEEQYEPSMSPSSDIKPNAPSSHMCDPSRTMASRANPHNSPAARKRRLLPSSSTPSLSAIAGCVHEENLGLDKVKINSSPNNHAIIDEIDSDTSRRVPNKKTQPPATPSHGSQWRTQPGSRQRFVGVEVPPIPADHASYTPSPSKKRRVEVEVAVATPRRATGNALPAYSNDEAPRRTTRSSASSQLKEPVRGLDIVRPRHKTRSTGVGRPAATPMSLNSDSSQDLPQPRKAKGKGRAIIQDLDESEPNSGQSEMALTRDKKKKKKRARDPDESDDSMQDGAALLAEIEMDEPVHTQTRLRDRAPKESGFSQALERLKARKAGKAMVEEADESVDTMWLEEDSDAPQDEDFIEEDGGFDANQLPIEYRLSSFQHFSHHFKVIAQYFVNLAVVGDAYAIEQDAAYYRVAFRAFRKKLDGLRDSQITSSVWRASFKRALATYPEFESIELDEAVDGCDACHMGGRMSKYIGSLGGAAYDPKIFSILPRDDEDDDRYEKAEFDRKEFKLGRFCRTRVEVYHDFCHWELAIYTAVSHPYDRLKRQVRNNERVSGWSGKLRDADAVLKYLEDTGIIDKEWQRISNMIKKAEQLDQMGAVRGRDLD